MAKYGLIGEKLSHSLSPMIHSMLGNNEYTLIEVEKDKIERFFKDRDFCAVNVTVPYKKVAYAACDLLSETARTLGNVNTIVKLDDGRLYGDNTDAFGFEYLLGRADIDVKGKKCLVIGSGGASATVCAVFGKLGGDVSVLRHADNTEVGRAKYLADTQVIVNTSPVGMYPHFDESPIRLSDFSSLYAAIDLIYNPRRTNFILDATDLGIKYSGGLPMLAAQAVRADEIFFGRKQSGDIVESIIGKLDRSMCDIVLIGMPGCGKTTVGRIVAKKLDREFVDIDAEIERMASMSIPDIFKARGEHGFREIESAVTADICRSMCGRVIATGGGVVTVPENIPVIRRNSIVFFIERPISSLPTNGRPLSAVGSLHEMYKKRAPLYRQACDFKVSGKSAEETADKIREMFDRLPINV